MVRTMDVKLRAMTLEGAVEITLRKLWRPVAFRDQLKVEKPVAHGHMGFFSRYLLEFKCYLIYLCVKWCLSYQFSTMLVGFILILKAKNYAS